MRVRAEVNGGIVHSYVDAGRTKASSAAAGRLVMARGDWERWAAMLRAGAQEVGVELEFDGDVSALAELEAVR